MAKDSDLTRRERELATVYATGASYREIALQYSIAPATVRAHLSSVYRKLGVSNKPELLFALSGVSGLQDGGPCAAQDSGRPRLAVVALRSGTCSAADYDVALALSREFALALKAYPDVVQTSGTLAPIVEEGGSVRMFAERHGARYLLLIRPELAEGRLSIRLIDGLSGIVRWECREGVRASSDFGWLTEMAHRISSLVAGINGQIGRAELHRIMAVDANSADAHELYLGALTGLETDGRAAAVAAARMAERCTQLAPHFSRGWLALNWRRHSLLSHGWIDETPGWPVREENFFRRAVNADPHDGLAVGYLALSLAKQGRFAEAQRALSRAEELMVRNVDAAVEVSLGLSTVAGKPMKALTWIETARMLDPTPHPNWAFMEARAAFFAGDPERAMVSLLDAPDCLPKLVVEILSAAELGEKWRAKNAWARLVFRAPTFTFDRYARQLPITDVIAVARYQRAAKIMQSYW